MTKHTDENDILAAFDRRIGTSRGSRARRTLQSLSDGKGGQKKDGKHEKEDSEEIRPPFKPFYG